MLQLGIKQSSYAYLYDCDPPFPFDDVPELLSSSYSDIIQIEYIKVYLCEGF